MNFHQVALKIHALSESINKDSEDILATLEAEGIFLPCDANHIHKSLMNMRDIALQIPKPVWECLVCKKSVPDYEPEVCCGGHECGCMGQPVNPCVCSGDCFDELAQGVERMEVEGVVKFVRNDNDSCACCEGNHAYMRFIDFEWKPKRSSINRPHSIDDYISENVLFTDEVEGKTVKITIDIK